MHVLFDFPSRCRMRELGKSMMAYPAEEFLSLVPGLAKQGLKSSASPLFLVAMIIIYGSVS